MKLRRGQYRPSGLVAEWNPGNGLATTRAGRVGDYTLNGNHGEIHGRPVLSFDGSADHVDLATPFDIFGGHRYAIFAGWFYFDSSSSGYRTLIDINFSTGAESSSKFYARLLSDDTLFAGARAEASTNLFRSATTTATISQDAWHSLIFAIDAADDKLFVWLDGDTFDAIDGLPLNGALTQDTFVMDTPRMQRLGLGTSGSYPFKGGMKYLGLKGSDTLPTLAEAVAYHKNPDKFLDDFGFDVAFRCNEGVGSTGCVDITGNGHPLSITGASWASEDAAGGQTWVKGKNQINDDSWVDPTADTTFVVDDGTLFTIGDIIRVRSELMLITGISTNTLITTRGYNGTTPETLADNDVVYIVGDRFTSEGMFFSGTDFIVCGHGTSLNAQSLTVECWVKIDYLPSLNISPLVSRYDALDSARAWYMAITPSGSISIAIGNSTGSGYALQAQSYPIPLGRLCHVAFVFTHNVGVTGLYVDGIAQSITQPQTYTQLNSEDTDVDLLIGSVNNGAIYFFEGYLSKVRAYKNALSASEILLLNNQGAY